MIILMIECELPPGSGQAWRVADAKLASDQDSSKRGAVETGCSDLYDVID